MTQNRSTAVMQRRVEPHDSLDDFPTPPWATRAACEFLTARGQDLRAMSVAEPCANRGYMVRPLCETFGVVRPSDVHDYGVGYTVRDYLFGPTGDLDQVHWTFMNPPFRLAAQFIDRALQLSTVGVAAIVRTGFLEGVGRYEALYAPRPPWAVAIHTERVPMLRGRVDRAATTATSYSWIFWRTDTDDRLPLDWIAPSRKRLERPWDYDLPAAQP